MGRIGERKVRRGGSKEWALDLQRTPVACEYEGNVACAGYKSKGGVCEAETGSLKLECERTRQLQTAKADAHRKLQTQAHFNGANSSH